MNSVRQWSRGTMFNPRSSHTKTQKMVLDNALHYKVRMKSEVEQSRELSSTLPNTSV